jgi:IPT/TIG domain
VISIVEFIPDHGPVGTAVRIFGAEFSSIPSENRVAFSRGGRRTGVPAVVTAATASQIVAKVPSAAISGPITVTTPAGSATSATAFRVTPAPVAPPPRIIAFAPAVAAPATEVTIEGTDFEAGLTDNTVTLNNATAVVTSASPTALVILVPAGARSGRIAVATLRGMTSSYRVLFVPPPPYTAADVVLTGRLNPGERPRLVALERPATLAMSLLALLVFDGASGEALTLEVTELTIARGELAIDRPDAVPLVPPWRITAADRALTIGLPPLPRTGTYTILLAADGARPGGATLALSRSPGPESTR